MNFPVSFISRTAALMGEENCKALCEAKQEKYRTMQNLSHGQQTDITCPYAPHSRSTRCSMPEATMFRKHRPCFSNEPCASM